MLFKAPQWLSADEKRAGTKNGMDDADCPALILKHSLLRKDSVTRAASPFFTLSGVYDVWIEQTVVTCGSEVSGEKSLKNRDPLKIRIEADEKDVLQDVTVCEGQQSKDTAVFHWKVSATQEAPKHL